MNKGDKRGKKPFKEILIEGILKRRGVGEMRQEMNGRDVTV